MTCEQVEQDQRTKRVTLGPSHRLTAGGKSGRVR